MDPELIAKAHAAIARGADPAAVAARFKELTGSALPPSPDEQIIPQEDAEAAALRRTNARGGNALTDFLAMARHGASFGFDDDIAGVIAGPAARDEIRQRVADRRLLNPGASALSEVAGSLPTALIPVGQGRAAVQGGRGLFGAVARGTGTGTLLGGAYGVGDSDAETFMGRAKDAVPEAIGGGILGGFFSAAPVVGNAVARRADGRGARVAAELVDATGLSGDINAVRDASRATVNAARAQHYGPLDAMGKVDVPGITNPATLNEAQKLVSRLERTDPLAARNIRAGMEQAFPGLKRADEAYAAAIGPDKALREGAKMVNRPAADIERAQRGLSPEALTNFRQGELYRILANVQKRDEGSVEMLRRYMDAGPETRAQLRTVFADDASFNDFMQVLGSERSAAKVAEALRRAAPFAIPGLIGAGVATGVNSLFR